MKILPEHVRVSPSPIHGEGLFAEVPLPIGSSIEYLGPRLTAAKVDISNRYLFRLNDRYSIDGSDPSNLARYINHSCAPNCYAGSDDPKKVLITTSRDIRIGEELTIDYGPGYFDQFIRPHGCRCPACQNPQPDVRIDDEGLLLISPSGVCVGVRWTYEQRQQLAAWFQPEPPPH